MLIFNSLFLALPPLNFAPSPPHPHHSTDYHFWSLNWPFVNLSAALFSASRTILITATTHPPPPPPSPPRPPPPLPLSHPHSPSQSPPRPGHVKLITNLPAIHVHRHPTKSVAAACHPGNHSAAVMIPLPCYPQKPSWES